MIILMMYVKKIFLLLKFVCQLKIVCQRQLNVKTCNKIIFVEMKLQLVKYN